MSANMTAKSPMVISLDGNVGSGKSTLLALLKQNYKRKNNEREIIFLQEPVNVWENIKDENGVTILEKFYADQEKYSFSFQMMAYISRLSLLRKTIKQHGNAIIITERSVHTDKNVFAKMLYDDKKIEKINYDIYLRWFNEFIKDIPLKGIIYLKTYPAVCWNRIKERNREGENIPLIYSHKCHEYHEHWIVNSTLPVLTLDGNEDFKEHIKDEWLYKIMHFLENLENLENIKDIEDIDTCDNQRENIFQNYTSYTHC